MVKQRAKKATASSSAASSSAAAARAAKANVERAELEKWLEANDPLYDRSGAPPITISELLSSKLAHKTFQKTGMAETPYDWSKFRGILEARTSTSPRWFMQLREEDLLVEGGLEGVTVDCIVIAEASVPTLSPAHYIVKLHLPFSDLEDNAPERILPIEGQGMNWKRVVKDNGDDINAFLLQKRESNTAMHFGFGAAATASAASSAPSPPPGGFSFGFGATPAFGSGTTTTNNDVASVCGVNGPFNFGFGAAPSTTAQNATPLPTAPPAIAFGFGSAPVSADCVVADASKSGNTNSLDLDPSTSVTPLKPSEILFALWSTRRLADMAKSLKSGSRVVREDFKPGTTAPSIKLVLQNDLKDDVSKAVWHLILNKVFAKNCNKIQEVDRWIESCPVYEEHLTSAMQRFRANYVREVAESSEEFRKLYDDCHGAMETELSRIVEVRRKIVERELLCIEEILQLIKEKKIAEKQTFRLLKYYAANDVMRFRPFGKVSGVSEMGESADVCDPPAPVIVNPFAAQQH
ncbi:hypothetical protein ERJ75_000327800 [Trypanosoma vivax]|uniref:Nucleoporin n=1 Tax=Trypanosoma vivax (strain Y486) TaxID=1055687 RepID=G0UAF5_TRYVY|nr:hypothetical protein TRVL_07171 [Trypanosoma vivax]KAH8617940.1 hypothetical protein ERJ75_000327800 [Trypanosoma vivax]CCC52788.1 conserved hypothetical protein [Trypanosoma vivax Y486]